MGTPVRRVLVPKVRDYPWVGRWSRSKNVVSSASRILGEEGFMAILVVIDTTAGRVVSGPEITARGFIDDAAALDPIRKELIQKLEQAVADGMRDAESLEQLIRRTTGKWVDQTFRRRPMLVPRVIEV